MASVEKGLEYSMDLTRLPTGVVERRFAALLKLDAASLNFFLLVGVFYSA